MRNTNRWAYMGHPNYNPPNTVYPVCTAPSRTYFIGGKRNAGGAVQRWRCEHQHTWVKIVDEPSAEDDPPEGDPID
jgi:hypothetical protein